MFIHCLKFSKPEAEAMINSIREAFIENFKNLEWMDAETRRLAKEKALAITDMIGFPDYILNPADLDKKYFDLDLNDQEYFENNIKVNQFNLRENLDRLDRPVNKTKWGMTPPTANAYYTPTKNQIVFPAGILQRPFYDQSYPKSLNFGAMGVIMGHELSHAFDDQGREYDKYGNLHHWWNNETIDRYNEKTSCIVAQYSQYNVSGQSLNGRQTLGENIADNGGLKAAYHAYLNVMKNATLNLDTLPLPGVNLTHRQLFFVSFAQVSFRLRLMLLAVNLFVFLYRTGVVLCRHRRNNEFANGKRHTLAAKISGHRIIGESQRIFQRV